VWSSCNDGIEAVPADSLVDDVCDHSKVIAVASTATPAIAEVSGRFMGNLLFGSQNACIAFLGRIAPRERELLHISLIRVCPDVHPFPLGNG
jgi:hypothetical protein